ncbi:class I SAM-dependent methyltransferase [Mangrovimonas sp. ST2L15]|uniref:class I SAM-dependent methyltransferase n=1 Tax=Mangrovimonas sp. ST2L15 TaxID=1645916 RepID=UPI0006B625F8|nr:class I SAM-dependent methyltransferase [Mangrovimonas sp. ST2L15]
MINPIKQFLVEKTKFYKLGKAIDSDVYFTKTKELSQLEILKAPRRTEIINYFIGFVDAQRYLEIGVRNPEKNFNRLQCPIKFSVDPGVEFEENPVDFKMTSDLFFERLAKNELEINPQEKFDVIFIDGLHLANQVEKDISNSLEYLSEKGVIILHDCNPPTEYHQRETYGFMWSPARSFWNGTTWKAYYKVRHQRDLFTICFDCDWGVAVLSKHPYPFFNQIQDGIQNEFYEFSILNKFREEHLNLSSFDTWVESTKLK